MAQMLCKPHSSTTEASHSIAPAPSCYFPTILLLLLLLSGAWPYQPAADQASPLLPLPPLLLLAALLLLPALLLPTTLLLSTTLLLLTTCCSCAW
jgi:hypothetical protein